MTSFILQESANYYQERHRILYSCFLDTMKAFDRTWINGAMYKLFHLGTKGKDLRILNKVMTGSTGRVIACGHSSEPYKDITGHQTRKYIIASVLHDLY